jgi:hypothetical protein
MLTPRTLHARVTNYAEAHGHFPSRQSLEPTSPGAHWNWFEVDKALRRESAGWQGRTSLDAWIQNHIVPSALQAEEPAAHDIELLDAMAPA